VKQKNEAINVQPKKLEITNHLNDVYDALRETQLMTNFLSRASMELLKEGYSDDFMFGGRLLFDLLNNRFEEMLDNVQDIISEVKDHENLTKTH